MDNDNDSGNAYTDNQGSPVLGFLAGLLIGGLAGAVTSLLLAPQSGLRTRAQIQRKGLQLRDQATEAIDDKLIEVRDTGRRIAAEVQQQAGHAQQQAEKLARHGQAVLEAQAERWSPVVTAGQKAVRSGN